MSPSLGIPVGLITTALLAVTPAGDAEAKPVKLAASETAIYVTDMHCASCAKKISGRLFRMKGVMRVRTDVKANVAIVTPQAKKELDPHVIWTTVQMGGFKPVRLEGPQGAFVADPHTGEPQKLAAAEVPVRQ